ncbi:MAG: J domain-containing protein [Leptolyngbya sp. SIO4C1]|nr:J domain-containing protein [Leptolyngbya sp. SIO4C1]
MSNASPTPKTYYELLGLKPNASVQQIRRAYRDLSKLYHPDTTELPGAIATRKFQILNEAYATLSSPEKRLLYDQQIGYSRIHVMQVPTHLDQPVSQKRPYQSNHLYLDPTDRPLSAGEIFALFILGVTFAACLALVVLVGFTKGDQLPAFSSLPAAEEVRSPAPPASIRPTPLSPASSSSPS